MSTKYFDVPWATNGNKTVIPNSTQPGGEVSYDEGWGPDYALDQVTEPTAKDVERDKENQFKFDVTELLKEVQEHGIPDYNATYNYDVGGRTLGSDGEIYAAQIANGPATVPRQPVGDLTGTWLSNRGDVRSYSATFDYALTSFAKGSDGNLYRADIVNGPTTVIVDPVGDLTGTWVLLATILPAVLVATTVFTANDPVWAPTAGVKTIKVYVTGGGGGGGGGATPAGGQASMGGGGSAAGTGIKTFSGVIAATYAVVVGAAGLGGASGPGQGDDGTDGTNSSFAGAGITTIIGVGGLGGDGDPSPTNGTQVRAAQFGSDATGGDVNITGGGAVAGVLSGGFPGSLSPGGGSYWGGPEAHGTGFPSDAKAFGAGGGGGAGFDLTAGTAGDGAPGTVVVEEYF